MNISGWTNNWKLFIWSPAQPVRQIWLCSNVCKTTKTNTLFALNPAKIRVKNKHFLFFLKFPCQLPVTQCFGAPIHNCHSTPHGGIGRRNNVLNCSSFNHVNVAGKLEQNRLIVQIFFRFDAKKQLLFEYQTLMYMFPCHNTILSSVHLYPPAPGQNIRERRQDRLFGPLPALPLETNQHVPGLDTNCEPQDPDQ